VELAQFHQSLERVKDVLANRHREAVIQNAVDFAAPQQSIKAFRTALAQMERALGRLQARITSKTTQGRNWQPPRRRASKLLSREYLELELQKRTLTFRQARQVVDAIWESIKEALQRGEEVETPLGRFWVKKERHARQTRWRFGKVQVLYRRRKTVEFEGDFR
jgi:nucleoid DNA-binding protein